MKSVIALAAVLIFPGALCAEDLVTRDGTRYRDVTISRVEDNGLRITHRDGSAKVRFADLPDALRAKYGYDPKKAAALDHTEDAALTAQRAEADRAARAAADARKKLEAEQATRAATAAAAPAPAPASPKPKVSAWMQERLNSRSGLDGHQYFSSATFAKRSPAARPEVPPVPRVAVNAAPSTSDLPPADSSTPPPPHIDFWAPPAGRSVAPAHPMSADEKKEAAAGRLIVFFAARLFAHNTAPETTGEKLAKELVEAVSENQIGEALAELFPEMPAAERAGSKAFVVWLSEIDPNESKEAAARRLAALASKDVFLELLRERQPELANDLQFTTRIYGLIRLAADSKK